jgi:hypothetical protein
MNGLVSYAIAIVLVATSIALVLRHIRVWRRLQDEKLDEREHNFRRRQFRRRMKTSIMIGVLGVAIAVGQLLFQVLQPTKLQGFYWIGVLLLLLWIMLLAVADAVATSAYYSRERSDFAVQHAKLQVELRKARERAGRRHNGKPGNGH